MPPPLPADLPAGSRIYRREGMRRLEPDELQLLKHAARDHWIDVLVLFGGFALFGGLLMVAFEQPSRHAEWLRGLAFFAALVVLHCTMQIVGLGRSRVLLRQDGQAGEVLRFVTMDGEDDRPGDSLEFLPISRRIWKRADGQPLPPEMPWLLPDSVRLDKVLEIAERPLNSSEQGQLPTLAQKEIRAWSIAILGFVLFDLSLGLIFPVASLKVQSIIRSLVPAFIIASGSVLRWSFISRLWAARAVTLDEAAGSVWSFREIDPLITHGYRVPLTTTEVLPHSGLRLRDPYRETRAALTPDERKTIKAR